MTEPVTDPTGWPYPTNPPQPCDKPVEPIPAPEDSDGEPQEDDL